MRKRLLQYPEKFIDGAVVSSENKDQILRISGKTPCASAAGALVKYTNEGATVRMVAIGAGAVNQMVKACILARAMLDKSGKDMVFIPNFRDEMVGDRKLTAIEITPQIFQR